MAGKKNHQAANLLPPEKYCNLALQLLAVLTRKESLSVVFIFNLASIQSEEHHFLCFTMCICASQYCVRTIGEIIQYTHIYIWPHFTPNLLKIVIFELVIRGVKTKGMTSVTILVQWFYWFEPSLSKLSKGKLKQNLILTHWGYWNGYNNQCCVHTQTEHNSTFSFPVWVFWFSNCEVTVMYACQEHYRYKHCTLPNEKKKRS